MSLHNYSEDEESFTGGRASGINSITDLNVIVGLFPSYNYLVSHLFIWCKLAIIYCSDSTGRAVPWELWHSLQGRSQVGIRALVLSPLCPAAPAPPWPPCRGRDKSGVL